MKVTTYYMAAVGLGLLLAAAPAIAQTPATTQTPAATKQKTQDGASSRPLRQASGAKKQQAEGSLPDVGPGSKAYDGNTLKPKF